VALIGRSGSMRQYAPLRRPMRHETSITDAATGVGLPEVIAMRGISTNTVRGFLISLLGLLSLGFGLGVGLGEGRAADETRPPVAIQFSLHRPIDASAAPFVLAQSRGLVFMQCGTDEDPVQRLRYLLGHR